MTQESGEAFLAFGPPPPGVSPSLNLSIRGDLAEAASNLFAMLRALDEFVIQGPKTVIPLHRKVLTHSDFRAGEHDTGFVERYFSTNPRI